MLNLLKKTFAGWCVIFSALTVFSSTLYLFSGQETDTNVHILSRAFISFIGIGFYGLFCIIKIKDTAFHMIVHYCVTMGMVLAFVWGSGFFLELSKHAYRDIFLNYTAVYAVVAIVITIAERKKPAAKI